MRETAGTALNWVCIRHGHGMCSHNVCLPATVRTLLLWHQMVISHQSSIMVFIATVRGAPILRINYSPNLVVWVNDPQVCRHIDMLVDKYTQLKNFKPLTYDLEPALPEWDKWTSLTSRFAGSIMRSCSPPRDVCQHVHGVATLKWLLWVLVAVFSSSKQTIILSAALE